MDFLAQRRYCLLPNTDSGKIRFQIHGRKSTRRLRRNQERNTRTSTTNSEINSGGGCLKQRSRITAIILGREFKKQNSLETSRLLKKL